MALALGGSPAGAGTGAGSGPDGVTVTIIRWDGGDLVHVGDTGDGDGCTYGLALGPPGFVPDLGTIGPRPPGADLAVLTCNGVAIGLTWVGPHNTVDLADAARAEAQRWVQTVPVPAIEIHSAPPDEGLVGVESWFWLRDGPIRPVFDRVAAFGIEVDVRMIPSPVTWDLGDGSVVTGGAGERWPTPSPIGQVYQDAGPRRVHASVRLEPAYRVAGSDWLTLPPIPLAASRDHPVVAAQAIIVE